MKGVGLMATTTQEKNFSIGMVVSCKRSDCDPGEAVCTSCVSDFIGENIKLYNQFSLRQITTGNQSKQFSVSFDAQCLRPDCSATTITGGEACCTASADKCEMCLRTIVSRGIREMYGFHAKEIVVS